MLRVKRNGLPVVPVEIQDEVELYARESGRTATLHFIPTELANGTAIRGTWMARFSLRSNDKRLILYQQGMASEPPTEDVWFHEQNPDEGNLIPGSYGRREGSYRALDILQMGASGIRTFLERGNMWSGRGEFKSLEEQAEKAKTANKEMREKHRQDQKETSRYEQRDKRRSRWKIPFLPVGVQLTRQATD